MNILEKLSTITKKNSLKITFVLVPGESELTAYNSKKETVADWNRYWSYRQVKSDIMNKISNFEFDIIDLYYLYKKNDDKKILTSGHFTKEGHVELANYLIDNFNNKEKNDFSKFIFYRPLMATYGMI